MKPYSKTYRKNKDHKASECDLCAEVVGESKSSTRHQARKEIKKEINEDLTELKNEG